jgi:hypothetical protein
VSISILSRASIGKALSQTRALRALRQCFGLCISTLKYYEISRIVLSIAFYFLLYGNQKVFLNQPKSENNKSASNCVQARITGTFVIRVTGKQSHPTHRKNEVLEMLWGLQAYSSFRGTLANRRLA